MAEALVEEIRVGEKQTPESGLKCRQCRSGFVAELYDSNGEFASTSDLFVFDDDSMPDWIAVKVEEVRFLALKKQSSKVHYVAKNSSKLKTLKINKLLVFTSYPFYPLYIPFISSISICRF